MKAVVLGLLVASHRPVRAGGRHTADPDVYFSPNGGCQRAVVSAIDRPE
jgi:hypothetical protein